MMYLGCDDEEGEHSDKKDCVIDFHFSLLVWIIKGESGNIVESHDGKKCSSDLLKCHF